MADAWTVEVVGTPTVNLVATAVAGHVDRLDLAVSGGTLLLEGNHLRPTILVKSLRFEEGKGITAASYRGRGIWRPIVWVFRGLATSALRKLEFRTDILSVLHGNVLDAKGATAPAAHGTTPSPRRLRRRYRLAVRPSSTSSERCESTTRSSWPMAAAP